MFEDIVRYVIGPLVCYLIGAIPVGYIFVRAHKKADIRELGSGNIGATNAARILGRWAFFAVFALDVLKGLVAVLIVFNLFTNPHIFSGLDQFWKYQWDWKNLQVVYGLAAIFGHVFPIYLKFRGGKGVATSAGVLIYLTPYAVLAALVVWAATYLLTRYVSLGSILAAFAYSSCYFISQSLVWSQNLFSSTRISLTIFAILISVGVVVMHHQNIARLIKGRERKA